MDNKQQELDTTNVFVKFLPQEIDDAALHKLFEPFGKIISAKVMVDHHSWKSLGYGFVKYTTHEEARKAIKHMAGFPIEKKTLLCKFSNSFCFTPPSSNLYIKPLPPDFTEDDLIKLFGEFEEIQTAKIVRDPNKPQDVIGLVRFKSVESAVNALHSMNGKMLMADWPPLIVKFAESDVQRATRKANISPPPPQQIIKKIWIQNRQFTNLVSRNDEIPQPPNYASTHYYFGCASPFEPSYLPAQYSPTYQVPQISCWNSHGGFSRVSREPPRIAAETISMFGWYNPYSRVVYPGNLVTR